MENDNIKLVIGILIGAILSAALTLLAVVLFRNDPAAQLPVVISDPEPGASAQADAGLEFIVDGNTAAHGENGAYRVALDAARAAQEAAFRVTGAPAGSNIKFSAALSGTNIPLDVEIVSPDGKLNAGNITGDASFDISAHIIEPNGTARDETVVLEIVYPIHLTGIYYNGEEITGGAVELKEETHVFTWTADAAGNVIYRCELYGSGADAPVVTSGELSEGEFTLSTDALSYGENYELRFYASTAGADGQAYDSAPGIIVPSLGFSFSN